MPEYLGSLPATLILVLFCTLAFYRVLVGYQPHSGQDNYHGSQGAYGGDFEAQRHWMELTYQLPIGEWYWYDLEYWGLDYPPLSAYQSYLCGWLSSVLVGPESVALQESRGFEDPTHKAFMRATVIVLDLVVFGSAVWFATRRSGEPHDAESLWVFVLAMAQPAILLIDHGHFQYNTTAFGLAIWAFYFCTRPEMRNCVVGSIFFCLALSFKQMTLYYAPAIFCYLLGRCFADQGRYRLQKFMTLGATVIITFTLLWFPVIVNGPADKSYSERFAHVLGRIIPLQRGLFEGKVSNIWCVLSLKPLRLKQRLPQSIQPIMALLLTLALLVPTARKLFEAGQKSSAQSSSQDWTILLWGATSSALSFFLASFQVHEKSLLLALAPASLLLAEDPRFIDWFSILVAWTLWPLMVIDRLQAAYGFTIVIFLALVQLRAVFADDIYSQEGFFHQSKLLRYIPALSFAVMIVLHVAEIVVTVPTNLPDLFPVLWSVVGCGLCCLSWYAAYWHLVTPKAEDKEKDV